MTQIRSTGNARVAAARQSLTVKSGLRQRVKSGFREMANAELPRESTHMQKGVLQVFDFVEAKPGQKRCMATLVLAIDLRRDKRA